MIPTSLDLRSRWQILDHRHVRVSKPTGASYRMLDFQRQADRLAAWGITDRPTLCERWLTETGVAAVPGMAFERPAEEPSARLAYVEFEGGKALEALGAAGSGVRVDEASLRAHCGHVVEGMERLADRVVS